MSKVKIYTGKEIHYSHLRSKERHPLIDSMRFVRESDYQKLEAELIEFKKSTFYDSFKQLKLERAEVNQWKGKHRKMHKERNELRRENKRLKSMLNGSGMFSSEKLQQAYKDGVRDALSKGYGTFNIENYH